MACAKARSWVLESLTGGAESTAHSYMAAEVAYGFFRTRVDSSLTTEYSPPLDVRQDIAQPGKVDNFLRQVKAALNTRNVLKSLIERPATLDEVRTH